jgi:hypothetical protein
VCGGGGEPPAPLVMTWPNGVQPNGPTSDSASLRFVRSWPLSCVHNEFGSSINTTGSRSPVCCLPCHPPDIQTRAQATSGGGGATGACLMVSARVATRATSGVTRGPPPSFSTWIYAKPEWTSTNSDILYWYGLLINSHGALLAGPFSISANCNALFRRSYKDADSRPAQGMHPWVRIWRVFFWRVFFDA